jgi:multicomponent Na+:H+ antiporter subunit B
VLLPVMLLLSLVVLVRGHNEPGGGFVGGLLAAAGFALYAMAFGIGDARRLLRRDPRTLIGVGLLLAAWPAGSRRVFAWARTYMTGVWLSPSPFPDPS